MATRAKKTDEAALAAAEVTTAKEVTQEQVTVETTPSPGDFRDAMVQLGIKLCHDAQQGKYRDEQTIYGAICNIYNAIK